MLCYEYKKKTRCAKILLEPINKTQSKEILLFIDIKDHYACRKFHVTQSVIHVDSDLSSYDMIE